MKFCLFFTKLTLKMEILFLFSGNIILYTAVNINEKVIFDGNGYAQFIIIIAYTFL